MYKSVLPPSPLFTTSHCIFLPDGASTVGQQSCADARLPLGRQLAPSLSLPPPDPAPRERPSRARRSAADARCRRPPCRNPPHECRRRPRRNTTSTPMTRNPVSWRLAQLFLEAGTPGIRAWASVQLSRRRLPMGELPHACDPGHASASSLRLCRSRADWATVETTYRVRLGHQSCLAEI